MMLRTTAILMEIISVATLSGGEFTGRKQEREESLKGPDE